MKYDSSYVDFVYKGEDLEKIFIQEFVRFRKENNLTQDVFAQFAGCKREKIARIECGEHSPSLLSLLNILGSIGYTLKIEKVHKKKTIWFVFFVCYYSTISETDPAPTVRPPSRIENLVPFSSATGAIRSTVMSTLSPGITISTPSGNSITPVTSVVLK